MEGEITYQFEKQKNTVNTALLVLVPLGLLLLGIYELQYGNDAFEAVQAILAGGLITPFMTYVFIRSLNAPRSITLRSSSIVIYWKKHVEEIGISQIQNLELRQAQRNDKTKMVVSFKTTTGKKHFFLFRSRIKDGMNAMQWFKRLEKEL